MTGRASQRGEERVTPAELADAILAGLRGNLEPARRLGDSGRTIDAATRDEADLWLISYLDAQHEDDDRRLKFFKIITPYMAEGLDDWSRIYERMTDDERARARALNVPYMWDLLHRDEQ